MAQEPGFFDQRNPPTDEPPEHVLALSPRTVITVDGVQYKVTRGGELHVNTLPTEGEKSTESE